MNKRLNVFLSLLDTCDVLADVGCDHGLFSKMALDSNKCNSVIISDISSKSLKKAEDLLKDYKGRVKSCVCDGFSLYEGEADTAIIAGMGGEEICSILSNAKILPKTLILAPQKNVDKVRRLLISKNYKILRDFTFCDKKFYDVILATVGKDSYNEKEFLFGRDNLKELNFDFISKLKFEKGLILDILKNGSENFDNVDLQNKLVLINEVINEN